MAELPIPKDAATSARLSKQRTTGTKPEELFQEALQRRGYRVDRNVADLPGRPDLVLPRRRIAIFVHGCFWHGCPKHGSIPRNNREWWQRKLEANKARDRRKARQLRRLGWRVLIVWEHTKAEDLITRVIRSSSHG